MVVFGGRLGRRRWIAVRRLQTKLNTLKYTYSMGNGGVVAVNEL